MRIIAGEMRSRTILTPKGTDTRPTLDRTRESLFNIIAAWCPDARVLDLYAGSGALALEAISRGAQSADFFIGRHGYSLLFSDTTSYFLAHTVRPYGHSPYNSVYFLVR